MSPDAGPIEEHVAPWRARLDLSLVVNDHAADRNNWYSLLLGLDAWQPVAEGVVVVNSDLYADPGWFGALLPRMADRSTGATLAVDPARGRTDEAMKVALDPAGRVAAIGKVGIDEPGGEYVGLAWWGPTRAAELRHVLASFDGEPRRVDCWYEHGIQAHLETGAAYGSVRVPSSSWVEIDDEDDLRSARRLPVAR